MSAARTPSHPAARTPSHSAGRVPSTTHRTPTSVSPTSSTSGPASAGLGRRTLAVAFDVTLGVAGVLSLLASASPDGLEAVAERLGFAAAAREGQAPLAGYLVPILGDAPWSGSVAGVVGVLVVLLVTLGLARLLKPRS